MLTALAGGAWLTLVLLGGVLVLHGAGLWALAYTVNDESPARWLLGLGLDGIITDAVDRFSPAASGVFD